jgi:23S rRNA (adenine2503-C2)-methyltransferase
MTRASSGSAASASASQPSGANPVLAHDPVVIDISELELTELEDEFAARSIPRFHARQVFTWVWKRGVTDFGKMTDLPLTLRASLAQHFTVATPVIETREVSEDGTQKFVLRLHDGRRIESVYIPDTPAQTFCISTQVGCAMGCAFCLTGKMGLVRHLSAGEIASQARVLSHALGLEQFNIVLMGMGEPLHNYDATMKALRIVHARQGLDVSPRRVTLSTVGLVPMLDKLAQEPLMPNLAVSLHATTEEQRAAIVPTTKKYSVEDIIDACRRFPLARRSRITFEYVLLAGVNDSIADARRLAKLLTGIKAKVNLIPLNAAPGIPFERPSDRRIDDFGRTLAQHGVIVSVRKSRGRDIRAACGQLIVEGQQRSAGQRLADALR